MRAITRAAYGSPDVLRFEEVTTPQPKDDEVLIRVHAASVNAADWHLLRGEPFLVRFAFGLTKPKNGLLGGDVAGLVEAVGKDVTRFKPGDEVFGEIPPGSFAEYACARAELLAPKPARLSFEEAAAVPMAALTALQGLRDKGRIQPGQRVLIHGASGGVGTFAVQIAKALGADVTAVCSATKMDLARSLGADHVIDYAREDVTRGKQRYDLILVANGDRSPSDYKRALGPRGVLVVAGGSMKQLFRAMLFSPFMSRSDGQKLFVLAAKANQKDLAFVAQLIEDGKVAPVIDRRYPLPQAPDAIRYVEAGHARGKVVIIVQ